MTIGPLQLLLVKFADEQRTRSVSEEIKNARKSGAIRLVDFLYVYKDMNGVLQEKQFSDLYESQKAEYGLVLRGLLGTRAAYKTDGDVDKIVEAMSFSAGDFGITSNQVQMIGDQLPNGGSAILTLFEHTWALKLKEALLNAGGELIAQGLLSPEVLALGGTKLEDAIQAAQQIEADAEQAAAAQLTEAQQAAAAQVAEADQKLQQARAEAEAKLAEAQRVLDEADAQVAAKMEQAKIVAAAAIAASVRTAAEQMQEADVQAEKARRESEALIEQSKLDAAANVALGGKLASGEMQQGRQIAQETIEQGVQTAEQIKAAAVTEALKILVEAQLIKREAARQAIVMLASASLIQQSVAEETLASQLSAAPGDIG